MIREKMLKLKQWVKIHPKTTVMYAICIAVLLLVVLVAGEMVRIGGMLGRGEVVNPFTFDQVTGLVFVVSGFVMLLAGWVLFTYWVDVFSDLPRKEEKKYEEKLVRKRSD